MGFIILLITKDDQHHRADELYIRSLCLNCWGRVLAQLWFQLTNLHCQEEAINALKISINLDPDVADVWCNLGLAYYGLDRFEEAEKMLPV